MTEKELKWRKSLNKYIITGIAFSVLGFAIMLIGLIFKDCSNILYPFGGAFVFVGIVFIIMATFFLKQKKISAKTYLRKNQKCCRHFYRKYVIPERSCNMSYHFSKTKRFILFIFFFLLLLQ